MSCYLVLLTCIVNSLLTLTLSKHTLGYRSDYNADYYSWDQDCRRNNFMAGESYPGRPCSTFSSWILKYNQEVGFIERTFNIVVGSFSSLAKLVVDVISNEYVIQLPNSLFIMERKLPNIDANTDFYFKMKYRFPQNSIQSKVIIRLKTKRSLSFYENTLEPTTSNKGKVQTLVFPVRPSETLTDIVMELVPVVSFSTVGFMTLLGIEYGTCGGDMHHLGVGGCVSCKQFANASNCLTVNKCDFVGNRHKQCCEIAHHYDFAKAKNTMANNCDHILGDIKLLRNISKRNCFAKLNTKYNSQLVTHLTYISDAKLCYLKNKPMMKKFVSAGTLFCNSKTPITSKYDLTRWAELFCDLTVGADAKSCSKSPQIECATCRPGHFLNSNKKCLPCKPHPHCSTPYPNPSEPCLPATNYKKCKSCTSGFFVDAAGICQVCPPPSNCNQPDPSSPCTRCISCASGFSVDAAGICQVCLPPSNCNQPDPSSPCTRCISCASGFSVNAAGICQVCPPPSNCNQPNPSSPCTQCISCASGFYADTVGKCQSCATLTIARKGKCKEISNVALCSATNGIVDNITCKPNSCVAGSNDIGTVGKCNNCQRLINCQPGKSINGCISGTMALKCQPGGCLLGFLSDANGDCLVCQKPTNCLKPDPSAPCSKCISCASGFYVATAGNCQTCATSTIAQNANCLSKNEVLDCKKADVDVKCTSCSIGWFDESKFQCLQQQDCQDAFKTVNKILMRRTEKKFEYVKQCKDLSFVNQSINFIAKGTFDGLSNLQNLFLYNNNISRVPYHIFDDTGLVPNSTYASLNNCEGLCLDNKTMCSIIAFELKDQHLKKKKGDSYSYLENCNSLNLSNYSIKTLGPKVFENLTSVKNIDLSKNNITKIPSGIFDGLENLQTNLFLDMKTQCSLYGFDLSENGVLSGKNGTKFNYMSNCLSLDLSNYKITNIDKHAFKAMSKLTNLNLGFNLLSELDVTTLSPLTKLTNVALNNNQLQEKTLDNAILHLLYSKNKINIMNNQFSCCGIMKLQIDFKNISYSCSISNNNNNNNSSSSNNNNNSNNNTLATQLLTNIPIEQYKESFKACTNIQSNIKDDNKDNKNVIVIAATVSVVVLLCLIAGLIIGIYLCNKRKLEKAEDNFFGKKSALEFVNDVDVDDVDDNNMKHNSNENEYANSNNILKDNNNNTPLHDDDYVELNGKSVGLGKGLEPVMIENEEYIELGVHNSNVNDNLEPSEEYLELGLHNDKDMETTTLPSEEYLELG